MSPTEIVNFPCPVRPDAAVINIGHADEYIPPSGMDVWRKEIRERWGGCKVNQVDAGHVTGILVERGAFRESIAEAVSLLRDGERRERDTP